MSLHDNLLDAMAYMNATKPKDGWLKDMILSPRMARQFDLGSKPSAHSLYGIPIHENPMLPYVYDCKECEGSGYGQESTFCKKCKGAGSVKVEGMMQDDRGMTLITGRLPRKAYVRWPVDVSVPLRVITGLTTTDVEQR